MISQKFIYKFFSLLALLRISLAQKSLVKTFSAREMRFSVREVGFSTREMHFPSKFIGGV